MINAIHRFAHHRPRFTVATIMGIVVAASLPFDWTMVTRLLVGWNCAVWSYLVLMGWLMTHADHARVKRIALEEDKSDAVVLSIMSLASLASMAAIVLELSALKEGAISFRLLHYALTGATILGSWLLVAILYTFHYARQFYTSPEDQRPLAFPDNEANPNYWDFLYFSFTIAVAAQTSDVSVRTRSMRKTVLAQSVLSFFFNVTIVGLSINIAASIIGS
jgi:uncharacterized membrane protein